MFLSSRAKDTQASITLKVNEKINKLLQEGKYVYNMTSGQLPFKPNHTFKEQIQSQLNFLKSYQYGPVSGFKKLREKFLTHKLTTRRIESGQINLECIISNGSKHSIYNALGATINPGDEVIILSPYWVSYPEMIKFWGGLPIVVQTQAFDNFTPYIEDIKKVISPRTKAIIVNSPNNPCGIHYTKEWMQEFGKFMLEHEEILILSDEVYGDIYYFDPSPEYFYQYYPELLNRTLIIDGISKSLASTGLRVGYCIGDKKIIKAMSKIQSQTTSGPNSLIQKALIDYNLEHRDNFLAPIREQLRESARLIREEFREAGLSHCYYQTTSAFYYLLDFSRMPCFEKYGHEIEDQSTTIVNDILDKTGVALVPGTAFGHKNSARMSLTLEAAPLKEALGKLVDYLSRK